VRYEERKEKGVIDGRGRVMKRQVEGGREKSGGNENWKKKKFCPLYTMGSVTTSVSKIFLRGVE
jgi:hypothetical protein